MTVRVSKLKCKLALNSIATCYGQNGLFDTPQLSNPFGDGISNAGHSGLRWGQRPIGGRRPSLEEISMTRSKTLIAAAAFAAIATSAFSQIPWEMKPGTAHVYGGPGKMSAMAMAPGEKNHEAMMKHATKVPNNTVFFMNNGELYSTSGTLDPTGNFYRP
jgi:hypothetical protein